jgi:hypothetical protein
MHVRLAGEARRIESYLDIDSVVAAARAAGGRSDSSGLRLSLGERGFRRGLSQGRARFPSALRPRRSRRWATRRPPSA